MLLLAVCLLIRAVKAQAHIVFLKTNQNVQSDLHEHTSLADCIKSFAFHNS